MLESNITFLWKKLRDNSNITYRIFVFFFLGLMAVFVTSKLWLPNDLQIHHSRIGTEKSISATTSLTLSSWQYNQTDGYMEVLFNIKSSDDTSQIPFTVVAHSNRNKLAALQTSIAFNDGQLLAVQLKNVPASWDYISLWVQLSDSSEDDDTLLSDLNGVNFLCDSRKVTVNNSLQPQSELEYSLRSIDIQIDFVNQQIQEEQQQIENYNLQIEQLNFDITTLHQNEKYETEDEIEDTEAAIKRKENQIDDYNNQILNCQQKIEEYQTKIEKLQLKRSDVLAGKFSESAVLNSSDESQASSNEEK
jgi:hypothetical protein